MKKQPKRRIIYSNFYGEMYTLEEAKEFLFDSQSGDEWESPSAVPDDDAWREVAFQEDCTWEDEKYELKKFFDADHWILQGVCELWNRSPRGGFVFESFNELCRSWENCDYIRLYDENGHFYIDAAHHDGTNHYEVKRLTSNGHKYVESHKWDLPMEVHDVVFNNNIYSGLPHYAHQVFGCKKREAA